jgi:hypothetical protein
VHGVDRPSDRPGRCDQGGVMFLTAADLASLTGSR